MFESGHRDNGPCDLGDFVPPSFSTVCRTVFGYVSRPQKEELSFPPSGWTQASDSKKHCAMPLGLPKEPHLFFYYLWGFVSEGWIIHSSTSLGKRKEKRGPGCLTVGTMRASLHSHALVLNTVGSVWTVEVCWANSWRVKVQRSKV